VSSYHVIRSVSEALRQILWSEFRVDPVILDIVGNDQAIVLANPTETARESSNRLSLWLYQVSENEHVKNQPAIRANGADSTQPAPLALNLLYLLTPFAPSGEADHLLLGKLLQVLYDNAVVLLRDLDDDVAEELHIVLSRLTLEELTRVWEALREPYRLSVGYQVRVSRVDSQRRAAYQRVVDRAAGFGVRPAEVRG
jgi:hypothetical protein